LSFNNFSDTIGSNEMCMYTLYRQGKHTCFNLLWRICRNNTLKVWQVSTLHSRIGICYLVCTKMFLSSRNQNWSVNRDGILFPKLFRPAMSKSCSSDWEKLWNSRLKAETLQNCWDHYNNLLDQWKVRTIFETERFFNLSLEVSHT
jgi:hypothetical protein